MKKRTSPISFSHADRLCDQLRIEQQRNNLLAAKLFLETTLGITLEEDLHKELQDGVMLCKLINCIRPNTISSIGRKNIPFVKMANISLFLQGAKELGLQNSDLFQTVDLYEAKDMTAVTNTILTLARVSNRTCKPSTLLDPHRLERTRLGNRAHQENQHHLHVKNIFQYDPINIGGKTNSSSKVSVNRDNSSDNNNHNNCRLGVKQAWMENDSGYGSLSRQRQNSGSNPTCIIDALYDENSNDGLKFADNRISATPANVQIGDGPLIVRKRFSQTSLHSNNNNNTFLATLTVERGRKDADIKDTTTINASHLLYPQGFPTQSRSTSSKSSKVLSARSRTRSSLPSSNEAKDVRLQGSQYNKSHSDASLDKIHHQQHRLTVLISMTKRGQPVKRKGHFLLGNCIGKGQFGSVYRALDMQTGEIVAVKRIRVHDAKVEEEIMQEVNLLRGMTCPHIVRYIGFAQDNTYMNIVLEYVENGSLLSTLKAFGSLPEKLVGSYTCKILKGLEYLHNHDVVHCDLKAANILTTKTGDIKLTDFGVSLNLKIKQEEGRGTPAGTPNWMAPEVIEMKGACPQSDIWSLACTITELLTGKPPYADMISMSALYHIVEDERPPLPQNISQNLQDFLCLCFQKNPLCRPSATELLRHPWLSTFDCEAAYPSLCLENPHTLSLGDNDRKGENCYNGKEVTPRNTKPHNIDGDKDSFSRIVDDEIETSSQVTILTCDNDLSLLPADQNYPLWMTQQNGYHQFMKDLLPAKLTEKGTQIQIQGCHYRRYQQQQQHQEQQEHQEHQQSKRPAWVSSFSPFGVTTLEPALTPPTPPSSSSSLFVAAVPTSALQECFKSRPTSKFQRLFGVRKREQKEGTTENASKEPVYRMLKSAKSMPSLAEHLRVDPYTREDDSDESDYYCQRPPGSTPPTPAPSASSSSSSSTLLFMRKKKDKRKKIERQVRQLHPSAAWKVSSQSKTETRRIRSKSVHTESECIIS